MKSFSLRLPSLRGYINTRELVTVLLASLTSATFLSAVAGAVQQVLFDVPNWVTDPRLAFVVTHVLTFLIGAITQLAKGEPRGAHLEVTPEFKLDLDPRDAEELRRQFERMHRLPDR
jgi:hypothetical protein